MYPRQDPVPEENPNAATWPTAAEPFNARDRAYLRPLLRCGTCGKPATQELVNGVNARIGSFCDRCADPALRRFKEG